MASRDSGAAHKRIVARWPTVHFVAAAKPVTPTAARSTTEVAAVVIESVASNLS